MAGGLGCFPITASAICDFSCACHLVKKTACLDAIKALLKMRLIVLIYCKKKLRLPKKKKMEEFQHSNIQPDTFRSHIPTNLSTSPLGVQVVALMQAWVASARCYQVIPEIHGNALKTVEDELLYL